MCISLCCYYFCSWFFFLCMCVCGVGMEEITLSKNKLKICTEVNQKLYLPPRSSYRVYLKWSDINPEFRHMCKYRQLNIFTHIISVSILLGLREQYLYIINSIAGNTSALWSWPCIGRILFCWHSTLWW